MSLSSKDIEKIGLIFSKQLTESLEGINELVRKHEQTLYGESGANGLKGEVGRIKQRVNRLQWLSAVAYGALGALSFFKHKIFGG